MRVFVDASLVVYLNVRLVEEDARKINEFWLKLLEEDLYTDILVLD